MSDYDSDDENFENESSGYDSDDIENFENESSGSDDSDSDNENFENESSGSEDSDSDNENFENDSSDGEDTDKENFDTDDREQNNNDNEDFVNEEDKEKNNLNEQKKQNLAVGIFFIVSIVFGVISYILYNNNVSIVYYIPLLIMYPILIAIPYMMKDKDIKQKDALNTRNAGVFLFTTISYGLFSYYGMKKGYSWIYFVVLFFILFFLWYFVSKNINIRESVKPSKEDIKFKEQIKIRRSQNLVSLTLGFFIVVPLISFALSTKILNDPTFDNSKQVYFDMNSTISAFKNPDFLKVLSDKLWFYLIICLQIFLTSIIFFNFLISNISNYVVYTIYFMGVFFLVGLYFVFRYVFDRMNLNLNDYTYNKLDSYSLFSMGLSTKDMLSLLFNPKTTIINLSKISLQTSGINPVVQQGGAIPVAEPIPGPVNVIEKIQSEMKENVEKIDNFGYLMNNLSKTAILFIGLFLLSVFFISIILSIALVYNNNKRLLTYPVVSFLVVFLIMIVFATVYVRSLFNNEISKQNFITEQYSTTPVPNNSSEVVFPNNNEPSNVLSGNRKIRIVKTTPIGSTSVASFGEELNRVVPTGNRTNVS